MTSAWTARCRAGSACGAALRAGQELSLATMSTPTPRSEFLHLVVGYDGSPPAIRALDAAIRLLQGRTGGIDVVYVAHLSSVVMFSPGAVAQMESDFNQIERELRSAAE